ncbi:MAG: transposase [Candidatus Kerfeldbacteria bacterium]|nr:transposase [Candidatus Kerfeldbacteria bacterium]
MAKTIKEERLRWVLPAVRHEVKLKDAAKLCPYGQRSLERWVAAYKRNGAGGLEPHSTRPKTHPDETPIQIKEQVIALRQETKLCALKLKWRLAKRGLHLHERTIGKILKSERLVRKYRVRRVKYTYLKAALRPGELIEIDVKYVPGFVERRQYFQYTAIDCASRWRYLAVYDEQDNWHALRFLEAVTRQFPYPIKAVKTDNHATFTNFYTNLTKRSDLTVKTIHAFDQFCAARGITHYLIDSGKPAQNGTVERSHRSDQESFYDHHTFTSFADLQQKLARWNTDYNNLEHCGLNGKTPNEVLCTFKLMNPPNVRT